MLSAGGLVLTTAVISYGGPTLVAGLSSLVAGISSRFKESGQETTLSLATQQTPYTKPNIVLSKFQEAEERRQDFIQSIEAYSKTKEWKKFRQELGLNEKDFAEEDNEDEQIQEFLSPAVAKEQKTTEAKLTDFKELPLHDYQKRQPPVFPAVIELSNLDGSNGFALNGEIEYDKSGRSVSAAGDVNQDGVDDIIVGAFWADSSGRINAGKSYIIFGHGGAWPASLELSSLDGTIGFTLNGELASDHSGYPVSIARDVNGDEIDDLIVGAYMADPSGRTEAGKSYVVFGHNGTWPSSIELSSLDGSNGFVINGEVANDFSGSAVSAGDINSDGVNDLIVGAFEANPSGKSYIIFGHSGTWFSSIELSNLNGSNGFVINGEVADDFSGHSVSAAGDINQDGVTDLIVGAYMADPSGRTEAGKSYVVFGHNGTWPSSIELSSLDGSNGFVINGEAADDHSGYSVSTAGDINSDGIDDLIVGASEDIPFARAVTGKSYVVFGYNGIWPSSIELSSLSGTNGFVINGEAVGDRSGILVGAAGDVNGDKVNDLIIGAPNADPSGKIDAGRSYVVFGHNGAWPSSMELSSLDGSNGFVINGEAADDWSGRSVSAAGDVNQDGVDDIIVGAYLADPSGRSDAGKSYVIFGRSVSSSIPSLLSSVAQSSTVISTTSSVSSMPVSSVVSQSSSSHSLVSSVPSFPSSAIPSTPSLTPILRNNLFTINEGGTIIVTSNMLSATDEDSDDSTLEFYINDIQYGHFEEAINPGIAITSFTQQQIVDREIQFVHDGGEEAPIFNITVSDSQVSTPAVPANIDFIKVNDLPKLVNNQLTINQGETVVLTNAELKATDEDHDDNSLTFIASNVQRGKFEVQNAAGNWETATEFTQQEILDSKVRFVHDGSDVEPQYEIQLSDGVDTTPSQPATISFTLEKGISDTVTSIIGSVGGATAAAAIGAFGIWWKRYYDAKKSRENDPFASYLYRNLPLSGAANFESATGQAFVKVVDGIKEEGTGVVKKEGLVHKLQKQGLDIEEMGIDEQAELARIVTQAIKKCTTQQTTFFGQPKITVKNIENVMNKIAKRSKKMVL